MALIQQIDHLRVSVADCGKAVAQYRRILGADPHWEGQCDGNACAVLPAGNLHLVLAETSSPTGLEGICFRVEEQRRLMRRLPRVGVPLVETPQPDPLAALAGAAQAPILAAEPGAARGLALSFVERPSPPPMEQSAVLGLDHVVVNSADAERTAFLLAAQLGLDMRLDLTNPDWGARLMFFRCGDLILEVMSRLDADDADADDRFYGLSWRVPSADAAQRRLAEDIDVSEVRSGRKPGTQVFTVRSETASVPTLMIEPPSR